MEFRNGNVVDSLANLKVTELKPNDVNFTEEEYLKMYSRLKEMHKKGRAMSHSNYVVLRIFLSKIKQTIY